MGPGMLKTRPHTPRIRLLQSTMVSVSSLRARDPALVPLLLVSPSWFNPIRLRLRRRRVRYQDKNLLLMTIRRNRERGRENFAHSSTSKFHFKEKPAGRADDLIKSKRRARRKHKYERALGKHALTRKSKETLLWSHRERGKAGNPKLGNIHPDKNEKLLLVSLVSAFPDHFGLLTSMCFFFFPSSSPPLSNPRGPVSSRQASKPGSRR